MDIKLSNMMPLKDEGLEKNTYPFLKISLGRLALEYSNTIKENH